MTRSSFISVVLRDLSDCLTYPLHFVLSLYSYVSTPYGQVKVYESGPEDGEKLILVHGITTPSTMWKDIVPKLKAAGFRVMVYDLYGRGYSDAPIVIHDVALYVSQISFILNSKPEWQTFNIAGMSLGGPIGESTILFFSFFQKKVLIE